MANNKRISVRIVRRRARKQYVLRWGKKQQEQVAKAKWGDEAAAYREAFELEDRLNNPAQAILAWDAACESYEKWHLAMYSPDHMANWLKAKRRFEAFCGTVPDLTHLWPKVTEFAAAMTKQVAMTTVRGYCQYLRSFLRWCHHQGWLDQPPRRLALPRTRGDKRGKGRPLSGEEFDRLLAAIPGVVGPDHAPSWTYLCWGLWHSSLRLGEAVRLHWTDGPIQVDLSDEYPMVRFAAEGDKGRRSRLLPMTREFSDMLTGPRRGFVFRPTLIKGPTRCRDTWSHKIGEFGKAAGVIVDRNEKTGSVKYASAHDLRRSCIDRMRRVLRDDLFRAFARHEDERTTQQYYLGESAKQIAAALWGVTNQ